MTETDFKQIETNLLDQIEYQRKLNDQILGRTDAYRDIIKMLFDLLIEKAGKNNEDQVSDYS